MSARVINDVTRYSSVTSLLRKLKWLPIKTRIEFRQSVLVHRCLFGDAPSYLSNELTLVSSLEGRSRLRSASSSALLVPAVRRPTIGGRSFTAAAVRTWNSSPSSLTSDHVLSSFKRRLKEHLLHISYSS